jgi:hypothetical protein
MASLDCSSQRSLEKENSRIRLAHTFSKVTDTNSSDKEKSKRADIS